MIIIKVQLSLASSEKERQMLVYNKDRSVMFQAPAPPEVVERVGNRPKAYFYASAEELSSEEPSFILGQEAPTQSW